MDNELYAGKNTDRSKWPMEGRICEQILELGDLLQKSQYWERYQIMSSKMGSDCVLSLKLAKIMFEKDPNIKQIQEKLILLGEFTNYKDV